MTAPPEALRALGRFEAPRRPDSPSPAERLTHSGVPNRLVGGIGLAYVVLEAGRGTSALTLDTVNLVFLCLGVFLHASLAAVLKASEEAARSLRHLPLRRPLVLGRPQLRGALGRRQVGDRGPVQCSRRDAPSTCPSPG